MKIDLNIQSALIGLATVVVTTFGSISIAKLNKIHTLTNSNLTAANKRLDDALIKIDELNKLIIEMGKRAPSKAEPLPAP